MPKKQVIAIVDDDELAREGNICIEPHTMIDDADRPIADANANRFGAAGKNAKNGAPLSLSRLAGDVGGSPPDVKQPTKTGRVNGGAARTFSFGPFHLIPTQRLLLEAGKPLRLGSRALDILIALVERHGELLSKEELMARVWPKMFVEPSNLTVHVAALRRVLGDGRNGNRYLVNIPGRGYRFVAPVRVADEAMPSLPQLQPIVASGANNLPAQITRLVGRAEALRTLAAQLSEQRFITIVGPGGIGKTSVALAVAEAVAGSYEHGVWIVDLAHLSDPSLVPDALASEALSDDPLPSLVESIRSKQMLLVLDNCAHLVEAAASLAGRILRGAPGVRILATSREPLRVEGEHRHRLSPLDVPPASVPLTAAEALRFSAIELFVQRAAAKLDGFELNDSDASIVADLCRKLDGLPLAIEFAAEPHRYFRCARTFRASRRQPATVDRRLSDGAAAASISASDARLEL